MSETLEKRLLAPANQFLLDPEVSKIGTALFQEAAAELKAGRERIEALDKECEERIKAYKIAHDQAMENGQARREAEAARDKALAELGICRQERMDITRERNRLRDALQEIVSNSNEYAAMATARAALKETSGEQDG